MNNSKSNQEQGLDCPVCKFKIKFTMMDIIMKKEIVCPSCHLVLSMDAPTNMKEHLQEISLAEKMKK